MADRPNTDALSDQLREMAETKRSIVDAQQLPGDDRYADAFLLEAAATALDRLSEYEQALRDALAVRDCSEAEGQRAALAHVRSILRAALSGSAGNEPLKAEAET